MRAIAQRVLATSSLALLSLLLCPRGATAGGMEVGDTGAEALGRGGAFVAKADNPAAVNYNPAGWVKLRGHHITVSANAVRSVYDFTRAGDGGGQRDTAGGNDYPTISSTKPWFAAPLHLMATTDLGLFDRVTLAGGFYAPSATARAYPAQIETGGKTVGAPQRYDMVDTGGLILFPTVGVAFRPIGWLDIGVTFQWVVTQVEATNYGTASAACEQAEDPGCDIVMNVKGQDLFAPTGSVGALLRPTPNLEIGALLRLPSKSELKGKADVTIGPELKRLESYLKYSIIEPESPEITITNAYPLMFRLGGRYIFRAGDEEIGDIEADFIFENWAGVSERVVTIKGKSMNKPMDPVVMDSRMKNTLGVRLGGSYRLRVTRSLDLILRAGGFFETESTAVSDTSLQVLGPRRIGLAGGLGARWGRFSLDLAYAHLFLPSRVVHQSSITAQDFTSDAGGPVVGNGTYRASVDMLSMQLSVAFGEGAKPRFHDPEPLPRIEEPEEPQQQPERFEEPDAGEALSSAVAPSATPRRPAEPPCTGALCFDPDPILRSRPAPAPARLASPAPRRRPVPIEDEVDQLMGKEPQKQLPIEDEVDQLMQSGGRSKKIGPGRTGGIRRSRRTRRYRRGHRRTRHTRGRHRSARRDRAGSWRRGRHAPRGARCIRRDDLGRCRTYRHHGRIYVSRR